MRGAGLALCLLLVPAGAVSAPALEDLLRSGQLQARVVIESEPPLYRRAPVLIAVEIATPRWFTRGTRVRDLRVSDALVQTVSRFADNRTRRIDDVTWTVQRWRFRLYPRTVGRLAIPPLRVFVAVSLEGGGSAEGELILPAPALSITAPPGMDPDGDWVAAPRLRVEERWTDRLESYRPGDAITRRRRFLIDDAPAMLLPPSHSIIESMTTEGVSIESMTEGVATEGATTNGLATDGLSLYEAPAKIRDRRDRGSLQGVREETLVVTMETAGNYALPGLEYPWFNTLTQRREILRLPAYAFSVSASAAGQNPPARGFALQTQRALPWLGGVLSLAGAIVLGCRYVPRSWRRRRPVVAYREYRAYRRAVRAGDSARALTLLHRRMVRQTGQVALRRAVQSNAPARHTLRTLLAHAYGGGAALPEGAACRSLWHHLRSGTESGTGTEPKTGRCGLHLNPRKT